MYIGPDIIKSGLVLYLDAANTKSYPTTGTLWTDLSGNNNNGTLTNGPTFNSGNGGSIVFDGVDDYVTNNNTDFSIANNLFADSNGQWSVCSWFKFPISPAGTRTGNASWGIVGRAGGIATGATFAMFIGSATDTTYGLYAPYKLACVVRGSVTVISSNSMNDNLWHYSCVTWNGTSGETFLDGVKTQNVNNTILAGLQTIDLRIGNIGSTPSAQAYNGNIAQVSIYNRALSAAEILQNYNNTKSRFNL